MIVLTIFSVITLSALLMLISFAQLLCLESLRLRTRDLPSLSYFKDFYLERLGMEADDAAVSFALVKHIGLLLLSVLFYAAMDGPAGWANTIEALFASALTMVTVAYALPQLFYRRTNATWLVPLVPVLKVVALLARPVVALLKFFESLVNLTETEPEQEPPTSAENIEALIEAGTEEGLIQEDDRKLIQSVVEFGDKVVREVMTPRPHIVAIPANAPLEQLRLIVINEQYSRIPAYDGTIDNIAGFVHVRDMFELEPAQRAKLVVRDLIRPIDFVPESKPVQPLLREMQDSSTHMVIVVDEYGNTAGLATMEDVVEVIVGEIRDEHEPGTDVTDDGHGGYIVSGNFDLARLDDLFQFRPEEDIESTTVGGLVSEWLGHVPAAGEIGERHGLRIEVLSSGELRVEQVRISKTETVSNE